MDAILVEIRNFTKYDIEIYLKWCNLLKWHLPTVYNFKVFPLILINVFGLCRLNGIFFFYKIT